MSQLFIGIDLAIAKRKRVPIAACERVANKVKYVSLRETFIAPPSGMGNAGALDLSRRAEFVQQIIDWLSKLEEWSGNAITRVAIDAPASPCQEGNSRRLAEVVLDRAGISFFSTPTISQFEQIAFVAKKHLILGLPESRLPYANKIWMLVGFDLFAAIKRKWECIEVYPQAIVRHLGEGAIHKAKPAGFVAQCKAFGKVIECGENELEIWLREASYGASHDRLDAMMAAWIASPETADRTAFGDGLNDSIWIPSTTLSI